MEQTLIINQPVNYVVESDSGVTVISQGIQGPPGPPGSTTVAGATFSVVTASAVSAYTVVGLIDGQASQADSSNLDYFDNVCGIATAGTLSGSTCPIQYTGIIEYNGWSWALGLPVFLGTNGTMTQTPPSTGFSQQVGIPVSATSILLSIQPPIRIN